jgi:hypothetical protein
MKKEEKWIKQLGNREIKTLAKEHEENLITPDPKVRKAVIEKIAQTDESGSGKIISFAPTGWFRYGIAAFLTILIGAGIFIVWSLFHRHCLLLR